MNPTQLSDESLMNHLRDRCRGARALEAQVIRLLVEVEERRLDLRSSCSSMWDFCIRRLGMSESETQRRLTAARLVKRIPSLFGHLQSGRLTLSTLVRIEKYVTPENAEDLVAAVSGLTRDHVEKVLAIRSPRTDVPSTLRKLPTPSALPSAAPMTAAPTPAATPHAAAPATLPAAPAAPRPRAARLEPLSESRYRLQLTASEALRNKLERARQLMRHRNPSGDLAVVVETAMDLLVAHLEKKVLGAAKKPRRAPPVAAARPAAVVPAAAGVPKAPSTRAVPAVDPAPAEKRSRRVPSAVRAEVFARDGERCTFVSDAGERCPATSRLELDHVDPFGRGGSNDAANLRVRCEPHNRLHAEACYGRAHIERQIDLRRRKSVGTAAF